MSVSFVVALVVVTSLAGSIENGADGTKDARHLSGIDAQRSEDVQLAR